MTSNSVDPATPPTLRDRLRPLWRWMDTDYFRNGAEAERAKADKFSWARCSSFIFLHGGCLGVLLVGWSWFAVAAAAVLYFVRMFAITGVYHRYFSHRTYRTSRIMQFFLAVLGNSAVQRGPLWWAAVHRHHHQHSDQEEDMHSPTMRGFVWSHIGWMTSARNFPTNYKRVKDLSKFPELIFLNRFDLVVPFAYAVMLMVIGSLVGHFWPETGTSAGQMLVWGFFISTIFLLHATLCINSLAHTMGSRRFETTDTSRNNLFLALITLGEGWHNNHHHSMTSARQGFYWWEIDITYYILRMLAWLGLIWDLRPVPASAYAEAEARPLPSAPLIVRTLPSAPLVPRPLPE